MKILIIHYRYSISGGPERYMFNVTNLLKKIGHEVIHFAPIWKDNDYSPYKDYWPIIKNSKGVFHFNNLLKDLTLKDKLSLFKNSIYNKDVYNSLDLFIKKEKPDVALLLLFLGKLTPSVIDACYRNNIPIVSRISDFSYICLNSILHDSKTICEKCVNGKFLHGVRKKCFRSYTNSFVQYLIRKFFFMNNYHKKIDCFLIPSENSLSIFSNTKYFRKSKFKLLPSFVNIKAQKIPDDILLKRFNNKKFVYWGRVSPEKDIELVIKAYHKLVSIKTDVQLTIIGFNNDNYSDKIKKLLIELNLETKITIYPFLKGSELINLMQESSVYIFPSKIYDNLPQSVIESLSYGIPVIAADIGSLRELVKNNYNGYLYKCGSLDDLYYKMNKILDNKSKYLLFSNNCISHVNTNFSEENHAEILNKVLYDVISKK